MTHGNRKSIISLFHIINISYVDKQTYYSLFLHINMIYVYLIFKLCSFLSITKQKTYIVPLKTKMCHFEFRMSFLIGCIFRGSHSDRIILQETQSHCEVQCMSNHGLPPGPHLCQQSQAPESCHVWLGKSLCPLPNPGKS